VVLLTKMGRRRLQVWTHHSSPWPSPPLADCPSTDPVQDDIRCFWLCPWHRSSLFQERLYSGCWDRRPV